MRNGSTLEFLGKSVEVLRMELFKVEIGKISCPEIRLCRMGAGSSS